MSPIETQVLGIPTGEQDYHPALRGGVLALEYTVEGTRVERLAADPEALRRELAQDPGPGALSTRTDDSDDDDEHEDDADDD